MSSDRQISSSSTFAERWTNPLFSVFSSCYYHGYSTTRRATVTEHVSDVFLKKAFLFVWYRRRSLLPYTQISFATIMENGYPHLNVLSHRHRSGAQDASKIPGPGAREAPEEVKKCVGKTRAKTGTGTHALFGCALDAPFARSPHFGAAFPRFF